MLFLICGVLTIWYSINIIPFRRFSFTLRSIPFLKVFLISVIWSAFTVFLASPESNAGTKEMMVFFERFFFIAAIAIPFDIRDAERDSKEQIRTFPVLLGTDGSKKVAFTFIVGFFASTNYAVYIEAQSVTQALALMVSGIISILFIAGARSDRSLQYYVFGVEGISLVQSLLVALTLIF